MRISFPDLPYGYDALEPHIGAEALELHHDKHQRGYFEKLTKLLSAKDAKEEAYPDLETIIQRHAGARDKKRAAIFNNAAQVWNHSFFWASMAPGGSSLSGAIASRIARDLGGVEKFREQFLKAAEIFGSGWVWLVERKGRLAIEALANAGTPIAQGDGGHPLLVVDVWEHAYYLDYRNRRERFVEVFLDQLANWDFANKRLGAAQSFVPQGEGGRAAGASGHHQVGG